MLIELWIGLILIMVVLLSATANLAIRQHSRVELSERLEKRGKGRFLRHLTDYRNELLLGSAFVRVGGSLALVLMITRAFQLYFIAGAAFQFIATFIVSIVLLMVFGVAIPNAWAQYAGDTFLAAAMPVLVALRYALYPIIMFLRLFDGLVRRLAGVPEVNPQEAEAEQIEQEIMEVVSEGEKAGAVREEDAEMIQSVIELRNTQAGEIMTPRTEIIALPQTATLMEAKELITQQGHSRIPIYGENIDDIKGVLYAKDLLNIDESEQFDPTDVMRKVPFVPETKLVSDLLQEMRQKQVHLAVVLDEYGGTAGLVTIEDIVEQIVGDIADEYEISEPAAIRRIDPQTLEVDARVHIDELSEELKVELPEDASYDTIGGFLFSEMGKIPERGEEFRYKNVVFRVMDAEERKINRLRVQVMPEEAPA